MRDALTYGLLAMVLWATAVRADDVESPLVAQTIGEAVTDGKLLASVRPRFTWVQQGSQPQAAHWTSLRTTLGWQTLIYHDLRLTAEAIDVHRFDVHGGIDYRETPAYVPSPAGTPLYGPYTPGYYPLVVDPVTTDANRLYLDYVGAPETLVRVGRQLVTLGNQRFVGAYDWAQLPQAFNGAFAQTSALPATQITAGYFNRVRNAYAVQREARIGMLDAQFEASQRLSIGAFGVTQNQAQTGVVTGFADNSNRILGARAWGAWPVRDSFDLTYSGEWARQSAWAGGDPRIGATYNRVGGGIDAHRWYVRVDSERLGSNRGQYGFQTALGTTQLFTGRADVFATTPRIGLRDWRATIGANVYQVNPWVAYHRFHSDWSDTDLGHEVDVGVSWRFTRGWTASLEYADYRAGDASAGFFDARKLWATVGYVY
jgi:hypothetical protein